MAEVHKPKNVISKQFKMSNNNSKNYKKQNKMLNNNYTETNEKYLANT